MIENIREQLEPLGYRVISVDSNPEYLHLDMIFNIDEAGVFKHFCNLQSLGNKRIISLSINRK